MQKPVYFLLAIAALLLSHGCISGGQSANQPTSPSVIFHTSTGDWPVAVEVASNPSSRERGLMYRQNLEEGKGMLFVFDQPGVRNFWMKNMLVSIDIIYLDSAAIVKKVRNDFAPCKEDPCEADTSPDGILYVVEVPAGWAKKYGVEEGTKTDLG